MIKNINKSLQDLRDQLSYGDEQSEDVKYFDTEVVLEGIRSELQSIFTNKSSFLENISTLGKNQSNEIIALVEKLSQSVEKLHHSIIQFEEKDDYFESDDLENEETEIKLRHNSLVNITTPKELIDKLNRIILEPSDEDASPEEMEKRTFHGSKFKEKDTDVYSTEGPNENHNKRHERTKFQNRNQHGSEAESLKYL